MQNRNATLIKKPAYLPSSQHPSAQDGRLHRDCGPRSRLELRSCTFPLAALLFLDLVLTRFRGHLNLTMKGVHGSGARPLSQVPDSVDNLLEI